VHNTTACNGGNEFAITTMVTKVNSKDHVVVQFLSRDKKKEETYNDNYSKVQYIGA
jgi:hypothetical protein